MPVSIQLVTSFLLSLCPLTPVKILRYFFNYLSLIASQGLYPARDRLRVLGLILTCRSWFVPIHLHQHRIRASSFLTSSDLQLSRYHLTPTASGVATAIPKGAETQRSRASAGLCQTTLVCPGQGQNIHKGDPSDNLRCACQHALMNACAHTLPEK